jgi:hypothetical protein
MAKRYQYIVMGYEAQRKPLELRMCKATARRRQQLQLQQHATLLVVTRDTLSSFPHFLLQRFSSSITRLRGAASPHRRRPVNYKQLRQHRISNTATLLRSVKLSHCFRSCITCCSGLRLECLSSAATPASSSRAAQRSPALRPPTHRLICRHCDPALPGLKRTTPSVSSCELLRCFCDGQLNHP